MCVDGACVASSNATLPFSDSFTQPDGSELQSTWTEAFGELIISGNALVSDFSGDSSAVLNGVNAASVIVQADISLASATTGASAGLLLRSAGALALCSAECPSFYLGRISKGSSTNLAEIVKNVDCAPSTLASAEVPSQGGTLRFTASGSSLTLSLDGDTIAFANDSSTVAGTIGVFASGIGVSFDNFSGN